MTPDELFDLLDLGSAGELSRAGLLRAARRMGWHWREAPFFAVLDHFATLAPLSRASFVDIVDCIVEDPLGPFGRVLCSSPVHARASGPAPDRGSPSNAAERKLREPPDGGFVALLRDTLGNEASGDHQALVEDLGSGDLGLHGHEVAILLVDPQESFTSGTWKRSIGPQGDREVEPLELAFANCGALLESCGGRIETMFTRCPFPPDSYGWDQRVDDFVDEHQLYFVKPGNSALWPPTNGVRGWLEALGRAGKRALVVGGCTLNSCIRVSAIELQRLAGDLGLQIVVDLSLCGARLENYARSPEFGGRSSVESAVRQMVARKVVVRGQVAWSTPGE